MSAAVDTTSPIRRVATWSGVPIVLAVLVVIFLLHISVGAKDLGFETILRAIFSPDPENFDHRIVRDIRAPRAVIALVVGAALSIAGAMMQGVTRNPLAEPGLLGLMAGASFAVVMWSYAFGSTSMLWLPWIAAAGAAIAAIVVYAVARLVPGGATPLNLTLAGAAISAFLGTCVSIAHLLADDTFLNLRVWQTGSLAGRDIEVLYITGPVLFVAILASLGLARQITALSMGDEMARGLGLDVGRMKALVLLIVVLLTAGAVALAGPLGFIGLVIPHLVSLFVGSDYRWIIPYAALVGATYVLGVDIVARLVVRPQELSTGIITALIGAPIFVHLVRRRAR